MKQVKLVAALEAGVQNSSMFCETIANSAGIVRAVYRDSVAYTWTKTEDDVERGTDFFLKVADKDRKVWGLHAKVFGPSSSLDAEQVAAYFERLETFKSIKAYEEGRCIAIGPASRLNAFSTELSSFHGLISTEELSDLAVAAKAFE